MWRKKAACLLAVLAMCGTMAAGAADYTILEKAEKVETTVYGAPQSGSLNDRIQVLDKTLNGQAGLSGSIQNRTDSLYTDVYGNSGSDLSLLAAVNMMQWQYSGKITEEPLISRVSELEEGLDGKVATGSLSGRVHALRTSLLGNKKFTSETVSVPAGTIVTMKNMDPIQSKTLTEGDTVRFIVAEDVQVGDVVAIPRGMETDATVSKARKAGRFGRDGKVEISYHTVRAADGTPVALTVGEKTKEQYKRTAGAVGASAAGAIILGPVGLVGGLFVKGNDVDIPAGTVMYAETKANTDVVGFRQNGEKTDTATADMAASGVAVPSSSISRTAPEEGPVTDTTTAELKQAEAVTPVPLEHDTTADSDDIQSTVTITPTNE